jgi:TRAP-type C4-dicarboxylate transport system substrate-binding protein
VEIRLLATASQATSARDRTARGFVANLDRQLNGQACATLVADNSAFAGEASVNALPISGNMAFPSTNALAEAAPAWRSFDLPFAFRGRLAVERFYAGPARAILDRSTQAAGLTPLGFYRDAMGVMAARLPLVVAEDALGKKIAFSGSENLRQFLAAAGAPPQDLAKDERAAALADGRLDAAGALWRDMSNFAQAGTGANILESNHLMSGYALVASTQWWEELAPSLRGQIIAVATRSLSDANSFAERQETNAKRAQLRRDVPIFTLTRKQRAEWWALAAALLRDVQNSSGFADLAATIEAANAYP